MLQTLDLSRNHLDSNTADKIFKTSLFPDLVSIDLEYNQLLIGVELEKAGSFPSMEKINLFRNIPFYKVIKYFVLGGALSLILAILYFSLPYFETNAM